MTTLYYMTMESYKTRATGQLTDWTLPTLVKHFNVCCVPGSDPRQAPASAGLGSIYDPQVRYNHATQQVASLISLLDPLPKDEIAESIVYFDDMYHPGVDGLFYYCSLRGAFPKVFMRCLAQSIDPDDFIHRTGMAKWMRDYERMLCSSGCVSILCTNAEMVTQAIVAGWDVPLYNVGGLSFDSSEVACRVTTAPFVERPMSVAFASRLDTEKQPMFFIDTVRAARSKGIRIDRALILSGRSLNSNSTNVLKAIVDAERYGIVEVCDSLSKNEYYELLGSVRVLFNSALQDWTSWTALEAAALGCTHCFPAYRSFIEVFGDNPGLYVPWNLESACSTLESQLWDANGQGRRFSTYLANHNDNTVERICNIMKGNVPPVDVVSYRTSLSYGEG